MNRCVDILKLIVKREKYLKETERGRIKEYAKIQR